MLRHSLVLVPLFACSLGLTTCGDGEPVVEQPARPVLVTQPQPAAEAVERYPGEVRARHEPELAFRIPGKVIERQVEVGERVSEGQPLARLDPQDVRLQLEAIRAQVSAAEADLKLAASERERATGLCSSATWSAAPSSSPWTTGTAPPRRD